jgi:hypothetical protein
MREKHCSDREWEGVYDVNALEFVPDLAVRVDG